MPPVRLRVVEFESGTGAAWAVPSAEQLAAAAFSMVTWPDGEPGPRSPSIAAALVEPFRFSLREPDGTLRIVFGALGPDDVDAVRTALTPALAAADDDALEGVARLLCTDEDRLFFVRAAAVAVQVTYVRVTLPHHRADGDLALVRGAIMCIGNVVLVGWHERDADAFRATAEIDGCARAGEYPPDASTPNAELCSEYVACVLDAHAASARRLVTALDAWETSFALAMTDSDGSFDVAELGRLRSSTNDLQSSLRSIVHGGRRPLSEQWWSAHPEQAGVENSRVRDALDAAEAATDLLRGRVSDAVVLAHTVGTVKNLALAHASQRASSRLQNSVTYLTAFLLVPGLVFAAFGADVALPGNTKECRLAWMLAIAATCAVVTFVALRSITRERDDGS